MEDNPEILTTTTTTEENILIEENISDINLPTLQTSPEQNQTSISMTSDIDKILYQLINVSNDNVFNEPTCQICSSKFRKVVEEKWDELQGEENRMKRLKEFIKDKFGANIKTPVLENHLIFHKTQEVREIHKVEYINKISRVKNYDLTTLDTIRFCIAVLMDRLAAINSIVPQNLGDITEIDKIKSTETTKITTSIQQFLRLKASIMGEMKNSGEIIMMSKPAFIELFNEIILETQSENERNIVNKILSKLKGLSQVMA